MTLKMDAVAMVAFLAAEFPQSLAFPFTIRTVDEHGVTLQREAGHASLRPGGTVMGPTLMTLADTATYLAVLSRLGPVMTFTSSLEIHFLRRAPPGVITARADLVKLGRRLAVAKVELRSDGLDDLIGLATVTYALPER